MLGRCLNLAEASPPGSIDKGVTHKSSPVNRATKKIEVKPPWFTLQFGYRVMHPIFQCALLLKEVLQSPIRIKIISIAVLRIVGVKDSGGQVLH